MSAPQSLTAYGSGNTYTGPFVWNSTVIINNVSHEVYYNNTTANAGNANYSIAVNTVTNTWVDYGNDHPFNAPAQNTETNGDVTITLSSPGHPQLFKFLKPVVSTWGPASTNNTGEVFVQDAKIVNYGGITGFRFEQRGYSAASYQLVGPLGASSGISSWTLSSQSNSLQHHISNLAVGSYVLMQDGSSVANLVAGKTKVFCNFW